jgi:peptidoglycan biosynthesis protein MviN/MurJ (putative lipid II flippase)
LIWSLGGQGLALATAISAMLQVVLITWGFQWQVGHLEWRSLGRTILQSSMASLVMTIACLGSMMLLKEWQVSCISMLTYFIAARLLKMTELGILLHRGKK